MKSRYIIACAMASLVAIAPLSLIGASAYSTGPYQEGVNEPYVSPLKGFTYLAYDFENDYLVTKELAETYQPDYNNNFTQYIAEVLYTFQGGVSESLIFAVDGDIYNSPQLQATNTIFYIKEEVDPRINPHFSYGYPFSIDVYADIVVPFDPMADRSASRVEHLEFELDSLELIFGSNRYYAIYLDSILETIAQHDDRLVLDGTTCLFETIVLTFDNKSVNLRYDDYLGVPYREYNTFTNDVLSRYYTELPSIDDGDLLDGFEAIMRVPISFLSTDIIHNFSFGDLLLIILGFIVFGFAIKLCFGG